MCCLLCRNSTVLENLNSFQHVSMLFCAHLLRLAAAHQFGSHSLPDPSISCTISELHPAYHLPGAAFSIFQNFLTGTLSPVHFPGIFTYLLPLPHLMHRYLLVAAHHSVRCVASSHFDGLRPRFRMNPSSSMAPAFANSSAFSFHSVTNFSKCDMFLIFLCAPVHAPSSSQILIHKCLLPSD